VTAVPPGSSPGDDPRARSSRLWLRLSRVLAGLLFLLALVRYRSYEDRSVLGIWSPEFAAVVVAVLLLTLVEGLAAVRAYRSPRPARRDHGGAGARLFHAALLFWALGYLIAALADRNAAGRIVEANIVGSTNGVSAGLEWLTLASVLGALALWTPRLPPRVTGIALSAVGLLAGVVIAEGGARAIAFLDPEPQGFPSYRSALWERRHVRLNADGFRDVEWDTGEIGARRKVAIVGDSYAFGWGIVNPADRFGEQLAARLTAQTREPWVALNLSRPDSHTRDQMRFVSRAAGLSPDIVVLVYVFNDIEYLREVRARGVLTDPGSSLGRFHPVRVGFLNSYVVQELVVRLRHVLRGGDWDVELEPYRDSVAVEQHIDDLRSLVQRAREVGRLTSIVPFSVSRVAAADRARQYDAFAGRLVRAGLPVIHAPGAFAGYDFDELTVNRLDRHPNARAHRMLAEAAADRLADAWRRAAAPGQVAVAGRPRSSAR
jgi:hypothetical protein